MGNLVQKGAWAKIIAKEYGKPLLQVALATDVSDNTTMQNEPVMVLGKIAPIAHETQSINTTVTMGTFIPARKEIPYPDGGRINFQTLQLSTAQVDRRKQSAELELLLVVDSRTGTVIATYHELVMSSKGRQIRSGSNTTGSVTYDALRYEEDDVK